MGQLLSAVLGLVRRNLARFVLLVGVLVCVPWVQAEWSRAQRIAAELPALRQAQSEVDRRQAALADALRLRVGQLSRQPVTRLDAEIAALGRDIALLESERERRQPRHSLLADAAGGADALAARLRESALRELNIELRRQARAHLLELRAHALVLADREAAMRALDRLGAQHRAAYAAYQDTRRQLRRARDEAGWLGRIPLGARYRELRSLERALALRALASEDAHRRFLAQRARLARLSATGVAPVFRVDAERIDATRAVLSVPLARAEQLAARSALWRAYQAVLPVLPAALALLLGLWLVPAATRAFFYFVLAPLAARRPPLVIGEARRRAGAIGGRNSARDSGCNSARSSARDSTRISGVSQTLTLAPGDELLIRPAYCQSLPAGATLRTALLFDWRRPLTSIAAQLWMLNRLRCTHQAEIVVSSTRDPLDEVAVLELASGEAVVLQPRGLIGLIHRAGAAPAVRSHWRIGTLHAWLTLQLRYLAFEGPASLVLKGCRGVRIERAAAGRSVSQAATLGFSADARYSTVRAEPFLPYLRGVQPLFHDRFEGATAYFLYEEVPRHARAGRRAPNPLDTLVEAGLKAFGI